MKNGMVRGGYAVEHALKTRLLKLVVVLLAISPVMLLYGKWLSNKVVAHVPPTGKYQPWSMPAVPEASAESQRELLSQALVKNPGHTPILLQLARLELASGQLPDAAFHLREILKRDPDDAAAKLELGRVLFRQGDVVGALAQTREILKKHPDDPDALYNLGAIYANLGNIDRAGEYWNRLIALDPDSESGKLAQRMLPRLPTKDR